MLLAVNDMVLPVQTGLLLEAVGAFGVWLIVTEVVAFVLTQPAADDLVTVYVPDAAVVTFAIVGFCEEEEKLLGPFQL